MYHQRIHHKRTLDLSGQAGIVPGFAPGGKSNIGWRVRQTDGGKLLPLL